MSHEVSVSAATPIDQATGLASVTFLFDGAEALAYLNGAGQLNFETRPASLAADEDATDAVVQAGLNANPPLQFSLVGFPETKPEEQSQEPDPETQQSEQQASGEQSQTGQQPDPETQPDPEPAVGSQPAPTEPPSAQIAQGDESNVVVLGQSHEEVALATVGFSPRPYEDDPAPPAPVATSGADIAASSVVSPPHVADSLLSAIPGTSFVPDDEGEEEQAPTEDDALEQLSLATGLTVEQLRAAVDGIKSTQQS